MFAPFIGTGPVAGASTLLTMSGSFQGASPEGWAGAANETGGGASSRKLTIGYLLCNDEDHHPPRAARLAHAGSGRSAAAGVAPQPRGAVEQPARGAPPRTRAADHRPSGTREPGAGRSRTDGGQAGHGVGGERDERERHPPPPPRRHARPAGHGDSAARLSIPPLRLPPGGRQGRETAPTGGALEWPPVSAQQMRSFGGGGPPQRSPRTQWSGPLVSRDDELVSLPVHLANPSTEEPWRGHQENSSQHPAPAPSDQQQPPQEGQRVPSERAKERCSQGPGYSAPLSEAPDPGSHRKRPLPALWHPPLPPQENPPLSNVARPACPDTPRQRPYVPVEGRVARVAPWPRSAGGVGGAGLLYPPLRALRTAGRGPPTEFHGGLPPLLPPSSTSLSLVDLQRPPLATPLSHRVDVADTAKAPAEGGAEGAPEAASDRDPLRQPGQPGGDSKEEVAGRERAHQPPQAVLTSSVKAEVSSGAGSHIFPTDKPALDPVRFSAWPIHCLLHACRTFADLWSSLSSLLQRQLYWMQATAGVAWEVSLDAPTREQLRQTSSSHLGTPTDIDRSPPLVSSYPLLCCCLTHVRFGLEQESATPHACEECCERFPHRSQLQSHVRNVHERAGRPFECERCGARFRQRAHKQKHVAAVHLKEKPYTCKICLHCFGRRSDLYVHCCACMLVAVAFPVRPRGLHVRCMSLSFLTLYTETLTLSFVRHLGHSFMMHRYGWSTAHSPPSQQEQARPIGAQAGAAVRLRLSRVSCAVRTEGGQQKAYGHARAQRGAAPCRGGGGRSDGGGRGRRRCYFHCSRNGGRHPG